MTENFTPTTRTRLKRLPKRGHFDRETIYKILDEGLICHVGFAVENQPFVIPTLYARSENDLILHGSAASRMMKNLANGIEVCVTVTLVDGLVLARSAFHHSMNYRSVVVFGTAQMIESEAEKFEALRLFTEQIVPKRWDDVREPTALELKATTVLRLPISEALAKIRTGNPVDDETDYDSNVWAGVLPLNLRADKPQDDERLKNDIAPPEYLLNWRR